MHPAVGGAVGNVGGGGAASLDLAAIAGNNSKRHASYVAAAVEDGQIHGGQIGVPHDIHFDGSVMGAVERIAREGAGEGPVGSEPQADDIGVVGTVEVGDNFRRARVG